MFLNQLTAMWAKMRLVTQIFTWRSPTTKQFHRWKLKSLKAELDKWGLKKSGNKGTLVQRLSDAIISEKLGSQAIETDITYSQIESPAKGQTFIQDTPKVDDTYSFIEIKVKEVCRLEIEKLKLDASASYSNETIAWLFGRKIIYLT